LLALSPLSSQNQTLILFFILDSFDTTSHDLSRFQSECHTSDVVLSFMIDTSHT
jgi:hypothetical protein